MTEKKSRKAALSRLSELVDESLEIVGKIEFNPRNRQHLVLLSLLGSIVEFAAGVLVTLQSQNAPSAFVILRSALEGYVDLCNIASDSAYAETMHATLLQQQSRVVKTALDPKLENPYLASIAADASTVDFLAWVEEELSKLKAKGIRALKVKERFELAGELNLYQGPYASLCLESHNNLRVLEARHLRETNGQFEVLYFQRATQDDFRLVVTTIAGIVANSVATAKDTIHGSAGAELAGLRRKAEEVRNECSH